jgi:hypothetical protein
VTLDGTLAGTTPLEEAISADPGNHVLEISRMGYESTRLEVEVAPGEVAQAHVDLQPLTSIPDELAGALEVAAEATDVEILVDGSPYSGGPLPIGAHRLDVRGAAFEAWSTDVEIAAGETVHVEPDLVLTEAHTEALRHRARRWRTAAWAVTGIAVALLGTTAGLYAWNVGRDEDRDSQEVYLDAQYLQLVSGAPTEITGDEIESEYEELESLDQELRAWSAVEWATLGTGIAALGVGIYLFFGGPRLERGSDVALVPGPGSLAFVGLF